MLVWVWVVGVLISVSNFSICCLSWCWVLVIVFSCSGLVILSVVRCWVRVVVLIVVVSCVCRCWCRVWICVGFIFCLCLVSFILFGGVSRLVSRVGFSVGLVNSWVSVLY